MTGQLSPGTIYEIRDPQPPHGSFFAAVGAGSDILFFDVMKGDTAPMPELKGVPFFLRLPVFRTSVRAAGWRQIDMWPLEGRLAEYGRYLNQPVGSARKYVYDNRDGSLTEIEYEDDAVDLEIWAVWDAKHHILPILRFHFLGEATPLRRMIRGPL
jgi:hypothetical protein